MNRLSRACRRILALVGLVCCAGAASAAPYYVKVTGAPGSIVCAADSYSFTAGATLSWSLMPGSSLTVDATLYINGVAAGTDTLTFQGPTGSAGLVGGNPYPYPAQTFPYSLSYVVIPRDADTDGVSVSFTCPGPSGTGFTVTTVPALTVNLVASPTMLGFGPWTVGTTSGAMNVTVSNTGTAAATGVAVANSNPADFSVTGTTCGTTIAAGDSCTVSVVFKPMSSGIRNGTVTISRSGGTGTSFSMNGTGTGPLSIPVAVGFGSQAVGTTSAANNVTVTNTGAATVNVSSVTSGNAVEFPVTTTCAAIPAGGTCTIAVTFKPSAAGTRTSAITVVSDALGSPQTITATGTGTAGAGPGQLALPASVPLGTGTVGVAGPPTSVTVSNVGGAAVTVSGIVSSAPGEFAVSGSTCTTVSAGGSCAFNVTFTPAATGARGATITVASDGAGSPQSINVSGTGTSAPGAGQLALSGPVAFGSQTVGTTSAASSITVTNTGGSPVTITAIASSAPAEFAATGVGCTTLNPGGACTISVTFAPAATGARGATITVTSTGVGSPQSVTATGTGVAAVGELALPDAVNVNAVMVGSAGAANTVVATNIGDLPVHVASVASSNPGEFPITQSNCTTVAPGATCSFAFTFVPSGVGARTAVITVVSDGVGSPQTIAVNGTGTATTPPPPTTVDIIEYHHAEWDHYFMTGIQDEITKLDAGVFAGWARTGLKFKAYPLNAANSAIVCRFFSTSFAPRSSHFYTPFANECAIVKENVDWQFEGEVFNIPVPDQSGTCPAQTVPVYRLYNNGQGAAPNHRYTTELAVREQMIAHGWIPEGYGPIGVIMCAPQ